MSIDAAYFKTNEMNLSDIRIPGFQLHTSEQKAEIVSKNVSRLENAVLTKPPVFDVKFAKYNQCNRHYHEKNGYISSSQLKRLSKTQKHFIDDSIDSYGDGAKQAFQLGTLVHDDIEHRIKENKWSVWTAGTFKTKSKIDLVKREVHQETIAMIERYRSEFNESHILSQLLNNADAEVSFYDNNRKYKVRADAIIANGDRLEIFDYKTVANIDSFKFDLKRYGYDISAGMYSDVIETLTSYKVGFNFVLVCKKTGLTKIVEISDATLKQYQQKFYELHEQAQQVDRSNPKGYELEIF